MWHGTWVRALSLLAVLLGARAARRRSVHRKEARMRMDEDPVDAIRKRKEVEKLGLEILAAQRGLGSSALDLEKKRKEIAQIDSSLQHAVENLKLERLKAWASILAPIMAAVTVLGTVLIGYLQVTSKANADEDVNWRQTMALFSASGPADLRTRHVATLLKPFLESRRYRLSAIGVAVNELPMVRDPGTFKELLHAALPKPSAEDFSVILEIGRKLRTSGEQVWQGAALVPGREGEWDVLVRQHEILCGAISDVLRNADRTLLRRQFASRSNVTGDIPIGGQYLERCDFSGLDLTGLDFKTSVFDRVNLAGAKLPGTMPRDPYIWAGQIWWHAKEIDGDLLIWLIDRSKPYQYQGPGLAAGYADKVTKADWIANIRRLCRRAGLACSDPAIEASFPEDEKPK